MHCNHHVTIDQLTSPMQADSESRTRDGESADCLAFLREVSAFQQRIAATLKSLDLTLRNFEVLQCLAAGPLMQSAISELLNSYKASVSRSVSHLSRQGWVSCNHLPTDKRVCYVELTVEGNDRLEQARSHIASLLSQLNTCLGDNEQRLLISINGYLARLLAANPDENPVS